MRKILRILMAVCMAVMVMSTVPMARSGGIQRQTANTSSSAQASGDTHGGFDLSLLEQPYTGVGEAKISAHIPAEMDAALQISSTCGETSGSCSSPKECNAYSYSGHHYPENITDSMQKLCY